MGIRIHKVLGYGLTDLSEDDPRLAVGRGDLCGDEEGRPGRHSSATLGDMVDWASASPEVALDRRARISLALMKNFRGPEAWEHRRTIRLADHVHWGWRETDPSVLVFVPPGLHASWYRFDDDIDYVEAMLSASWQDGCPLNEIREIPDGIHPYRRRMHRLTGAPVRDAHGYDVDGFLLREFDERCQSLVAEGRGGETWDGLREVGFADARDWVRNCAPEVPVDLRTMLRFLGVFRDEATILTLRPILWTYWI